MKMLSSILNSLIVFISLISLASCDTVVKNVVESKLEAEAAAYKLPEDVGNGIRLDSIATKGFSIRYSYTATELAKGELDVPTFYKTAKEDMLNKANTDPDMAFYKKNKVKLSFAYYFKGGEPLSTIIIKPEDYKDNPVSK
jgi:hypothetical protein